MSYKDHDWISSVVTGEFAEKKNAPPIYIYPVIFTKCKVCGIHFFKLSDFYYAGLGKILRDIGIKYEIHCQEKRIKH
jgi:hypothetical protein